MTVSGALAGTASGCNVTLRSMYRGATLPLLHREATAVNEPDGRRKRAVENLAAALDGSFDATVDATVEAGVEAGVDASRAASGSPEARNGTLRMIRRPCGGKAGERLPVGG